MDSYRHVFRTQLPGKKGTKILLPEFLPEVLVKMNPNGKLSGTWDLMLWKGGKLNLLSLKERGGQYQINTGRLYGTCNKIWDIR